MKNDKMLWYPVGVFWWGGGGDFFCCLINKLALKLKDAKVF